MKIVKYAILQLLFLLAMMLCGAATMKVLDVLFSLRYESIFSIGFKVGFIAWLGLLVLSVYSQKKKGADTKDE